ncbi:MAG: flippase [Anaerolineae bacterium]
MSNEESVSVPPPPGVGRTIARNTAFGVGAQLVLRAASFIFQIAVINNLGDESFGKYNIVVGWATLFGVLGDLGITQYLTREIARDRLSAQQLFWNSVALRFLLAIVAGIVTAISALLIGYSTEIIVGCIIFTSSYLFQAMLAPLTSLVVGYERIDISSLFTVVTQVLFWVFGAIVMFLGLGFQWIVLANVINLPIVTFFMYRAVRRNNLGPPRFHITTADWWPLIRASLPFGAMQLSLSFAYRMDTIILSRTATDEIVGWYNVAYSLTLTLLTATRAYNEAVLPSLSRAYASGIETARNWYFSSVKVMAFLGLPLCVGGMVLAAKIVATLYKPEYAPAALALAILIWDIPFNVYHAFGGAVANSMKEERKVSSIFVVLSILNLVLNLVLIPSLGMIGASFATVLTDAWGAAQFYFLFRYTFGYGLQFTKLIRLAAAAALMGLVASYLSNIAWFTNLGKWGSLIAIVGLSAVAYLIMAWFSGAFSQQEKSRFVGIVRRRLPGFVTALL